MGKPSRSWRACAAGDPRAQVSLSKTTEPVDCLRAAGAVVATDAGELEVGETVDGYAESGRKTNSESRLAGVVRCISLDRSFDKKCCSSTRKTSADALSIQTRRCTSPSCIGMRRHGAPSCASDGWPDRSPAPSAVGSAREGSSAKIGSGRGVWLQMLVQFDTRRAISPGPGTRPSESRCAVSSPERFTTGSTSAEPFSGWPAHRGR
jgi:hypothetical protein